MGQSLLDNYVPAKYRIAFDFRELNNVQAALCQEIFTSSASLIVCAPTGCGKTAIFELNIIKYLMECDDATDATEPSCLVYIAPLRSLCTQKYTNWVGKFSRFHLNCIKSTGDTDSLDLENFTPRTLIVTTPEKIDATLRNNDNSSRFLALMKYCFVDEIHIIKEPDRGPTIEALITRIKTCTNVRFVCVSATMSNTEDIATWFENSNNRAVFYNFGDEFRPAPVKKILLSYPRRYNQSIFQFDSILNYKLKGILDSYSEGKPVLVFCTTRRGAAQLARDLLQTRELTATSEQIQLLHNFACRIQETQLKECIERGIGYHHAGLNSEDREIVEQAFLTGCLSVLACTSTLAMGLNLPAHLVVIKNTEQLINGELRGYTATQLSQMIGRAGRPPFDTEGVAIIMTSNELKAHYEKLLQQSDIIESCLLDVLVCFLNTEVVLGTVRNLEGAVNWVRGTFLYVRMCKAPQYYGLSTSEHPKQLQSHIKQLCSNHLNEMDKLGLILFDPITTEITTTELGKLVMKYHLELQTIRMIWELSGQETLEDLIHFVACCQELKDIPLRSTEKTNLNNMNRAKGAQSIRYPLSGRISTVPMKIACLLQSYLGKVPVTEYSLEQDMQRIVWCASRIANALSSLLWLDDDQRRESTVGTTQSDCVPSSSSDPLSDDNYSQLNTNARSGRFPPVCFAYKCMANILEFKKSIQIGCWLNRPLVTLFSVAMLTQSDIDILIDHRYVTLSSVRLLTPKQIDQVLNKSPPFGEKVCAAIRSIPKYELDIVQLPIDNLNLARLRYSVGMTQKCTTDNVFVLIGDENNRLIRKVRLKSSNLIQCAYSEEIDMAINPSGSCVSISVISCNYAGVDLHTTFPVVAVATAVPESNSPQRNEPCQSAPDDLSIGYVEVPPENSPTLSNHNNNNSDNFGPNMVQTSISWPVLRQPDSSVTEKARIPQEISNPVCAPVVCNKPPRRKLPAPFSDSLTKRTRLHPKEQRINTSSNVNMTYTWIPLTPDSTPKVPMIQTSMLDYMRSNTNGVLQKSEFSRATGTEHLITPTASSVHSFSQPTNPVRTAPGVPKRRRFRWNSQTVHSNPVAGTSSLIDWEATHESKECLFVHKAEKDNRPAQTAIETTRFSPSQVLRSSESPSRFSSLIPRVSSENAKDSLLPETSPRGKHTPEKLLDDQASSMHENILNDRSEGEPVDDEELIDLALDDELQHWEEQEKSYVTPDPVPLDQLSPILPPETTSSQPFLEPQSLNLPVQHSVSPNRTCPPVVQVEKNQEAQNVSSVRHGTYTRGSVSGTIEVHSVPLTGQQQSSLLDSSQPKMLVSSQTPLASMCTQNNSVHIYSSANRTDLNDRNVSNSARFQTSQSGEFRAPIDVRFTKFLNKWRNLEQPRTLPRKPRYPIDVELYEEGWEDLACVIHLSELYSKHGIEEEYQSTPVMQTPMCTDQEGETNIDESLDASVTLKPVRRPHTEPIRIQRNYCDLDSLASSSQVPEE